MRIVIEPKQEIIRLDIAVDNLSFVQILDAFHHLLAKDECALERHDLVAVDEDILDAGAEQVHQHYVVLPLGGHRVHLRDAHHCARRVQVFVHFCLEVQLREFCCDFLEFGRILLGRVVFVFGQVDLAERSGAELADKPEVIAYD